MSMEQNAKKTDHDVKEVKKSIEVRIYNDALFAYITLTPYSEGPSYTKDQIFKAKKSKKVQKIWENLRYSHLCY